MPLYSDDRFYEHLNGVAMVSSLGRLMANFFLGYLKEHTMDLGLKKGWGM